MTDHMTREDCANAMGELRETLGRIDTHLEHGNALFELHSRQIEALRVTAICHGEKLADLKVRTGLLALFIGAASGAVSGIATFLGLKG